MKSDQHTLPRDPSAEREAAELARYIWGELEADDEFEREAHVHYKHERGTYVRAEARSPLLYGSQFELAVLGKTSGEASRMLVVLLKAYRDDVERRQGRPIRRTAG